MATETTTAGLASFETAASFPGSAAVRVITNLDHLEEVRAAWCDWPCHRDADWDVYRNVLASTPAPATPYVIVVERADKPEAMLVGVASTTSLASKIAYFTLSLPRVRVVTFTYGGFLGNQSEGNSRLVIGSIVQWLRGNQADVAVLRYVRTDSALYTHALNAGSLLMRDHFVETHTHRMMYLPADTEAIYSGLSKEHRKHLRSETKRFRAAFGEDLQVERFVLPGELDRLMRDSERIAATTYQRGLGVGFSDSSQIRRLLALEADKGWLRGYVLYVGNRPCAFWIGCVHNDDFLSEYLAHDPEYSKYSPGNYLLGRVMEDLCREGVKRIDFGIGDAFYKQRFANCSWEEGPVYLYAPTFKGMQAKTMRTIASAVNLLAKRILQKTSWGARLKKFLRSRLVWTKTPAKIQ